MYISNITGWFGMRMPNYAPDGGSLSDMSVMNDDDPGPEGDDESTDDGESDEGSEEESTEDESSDDEESEDTDDESTEDDEDVDDKGKKKAKTTDDEEDEEEDGEEVDTDTGQVLTKWKALVKKYPDIKKDFPDVKTALYREARFTELFGNTKDAETALEQATVLNQLSDDLIGLGNPATLLDTIEKSSKDSAHKVAHGVLSYYAEKDQGFYAELVSLPIKQLLRSAYREGKGKGEDGKDGPIAEAAKWIHRYYFDNINIEEPLSLEKKQPEKSAKEVELENKLKAINEREEKSFHTSVDNSYVSKIQNTISEPLQNDSRLNEYTRAKLIEDITREVNTRMFKDKAFAKRMSSLYDGARQSQYSNDFKTRIINTALVRAKSLVPEVRKELLAKALGKSSKNGGKSTNGQSTATAKSGGNNGNKQVITRNNNANKKPLSDLDIIRGRA